MAKFNIVLFEPEIPANTGNIGRTCVATDTRLHLIEPLGFQLTEKQLKRAGMDYWNDLDVTRYMDFSDFMEKHPGIRLYMASSKAPRSYTDEDTVRIPMAGDTRCLNLGNSVAVVLYEALRQHGFEGLSARGELTKYKWK